MHRLPAVAIVSVAVVLVLGAAMFSVSPPRATAQSCAPVPAGIVSWWRGEGDASDDTGVNNGQEQGAVTYVPGVVGEAFHFDGTDYSWVNVPDQPALNLSTGATLEFWYKSDLAGQTAGLVAKRGVDETTNYAVNDVPWGLGLYYNDPAYTGFGDDHNIFEAVRVPSPSAGQFHHFAGTYEQRDADVVRLTIYVDGAFVESQDLPGRLANAVSDTPVTIGTTAARGERFLGDIDEVTIYNHALTAGEVQAIFSAGSAGKCSSPPPPVDTPTPEPPRHKVVVFLQGACSSIGGGDDINYGSFRDLRTLLSKEYGYDRTSDLLMYSYLGGTIDVQSGTWRPKGYDTTHPISLDYAADGIEALHDQLLLPYQAVHPDSTFILVGHSLGGLVAMEEVVQHVGMPGYPSGLVSTVITVDSPLLGLPSSLTSLAKVKDCFVGVSNDRVRQLYTDRDARAAILDAAAIRAQVADVQLHTVGNTMDCLLEPRTCGAPSIFAGFVDTQWPISSPGVTSRFAVAQPCLSLKDKCLGGTHSAVLTDAPSVLRQIADMIGHQN